MHRTRGKVLGVAVALAATGLLAACGDNDSTASSTPTLTRTTTATQPPAPTATGESPQSTASQAPETTESATEPEPSERPQPVPAEGSTSSDTANLSAKDKAFLDALKGKGITVSSPDIALSIGSYVCQGASSGASESDLMTFVSAMAGSDPAFDPAKMPVEQAGKIYVDTAKQTYCQ